MTDAAGMDASTPPPATPGAMPDAPPEPASSPATGPALHRPLAPLRPLLVTQFFGAFNDNAWKLIVLLLALRGLLADGTLGDDVAALESARQQQTTWAFLALTIPLMLFSLPSCALADRYSKRSIVLFSKVFELVLMSLGTWVLWRDPGDTTSALMVLALMGVQSAVFSPAKYGLLPELLPHERLSMGNGALEMWTFLAIIAGTAAAGPLLSAVGSSPWLAGGLLVVFSLVGLGAARGIPAVPASGGGRSAMDSIGGSWRALRGDRVLWLAMLGLAFFWGLATLLGQDVVVYTASLTDDEALQSLPLAALGIGVGLGSMAAGKLSAGKVESGLIPLGAIGMSAVCAVIGFVGPGLWGTVGWLALLGVMGGLVVVPTQALLQWRAPADRRGGVIALSNVAVFGGMLVGSLGTLALSELGLSARSILVAAAIATAAATVWAIRLLPQALVRLVLVLLTHTIYRVRVVGRQHMPDTGGVLLVPNHVSLVDGLFLMAAVDRPVRFIVDAGYYHHRLLRPFMKALNALPISTSGGPKSILHAFREAGRSLDRGDVVCIFAEGQITRTGMLLPFRRGLERIVKGRSATVMPVNLDRVWGSLFSHSQGRFLAKIPRKIPYPVTVIFGQSMAGDTPVSELRRAVHELSENGWEVRKADRMPLHRRFLKVSRRHPLRMVFADQQKPRVSRHKAVTGAVALARTLRPHWDGHQNVGVMLPPSIAGAMVTVSAALAGRTVVHLNFTTGLTALGAACRQAELGQVLTSRVFLKKANLELPEGVTPLYLEDIAASITGLQKLRAALWWFLPARVIERSCGSLRPTRLDDVATIIFSSGSTGEPKGIMLTHFNVDSNVEGVGQVCRFDGKDRLLGVLPLFHSFGNMTLWATLNLGMGVVFHPNPMDAVAVGELVHHHRITVLLATPTFLQLYLRRCTPGQFGSLRLVVVGAEKLSQRLAEAFEDHFGIRPLEGYGTTECAPVVAVSVPDFRAPGFFQPGARRGTVGQPLPGVAVRIVDIDSGEPLPFGEPGMLLVKGPNVMKGYLNRPDLTAEVMRDGWYVTGDIATMDEDGFIKITDRLSRFSKIAGEMIPHGVVEEALHKALHVMSDGGAGREGQVFAVTGLPDPSKGEHLAVLHTLDADEIPAIREKLRESGLPNLFVPRLEHFVPVEALPVLGTGKLDLRGIKRLAHEALKGDGSGEAG